jgi:transposase
MLAIAMDGEVKIHRKKLIANAVAGRADGVTQYRALAKRFNYFLKQYDKQKEELSHYRSRCYHLEGELRTIRPEVYQAYQKIDRQQKRLDKLAAENTALRKELAGIKEKLNQQPKVLPSFVKANVSKDKPRQRPGRKVGHAAALRPMPEKIDEHIDVPVPKDAGGVACCPHCSVQLAEVEKHDRIVEDIIPSKVVTRCYHTVSGYCPSCRKRIESRAPEQPPAVDIPHGQIGINALATAALLRIQYRLPYRLSTQLLADLPGLAVSPGAVSKQINRMSHWLEGEYDRLQVFLRCAPVAHMDETTWRVNGINQWLWTLLDDGTNNAAERALRPAVVMRKITGGSRSERGAGATAILMSVLRTARQQNRPLFETIKTLLMNAWAGKNPGLLTDVLLDSS